MPVCIFIVFRGSDPFGAVHVLRLGRLAVVLSEPQSNGTRFVSHTYKKPFIISSFSHLFHISHRTFFLSSVDCVSFFFLHKLLQELTLFFFFFFALLTGKDVLTLYLHHRPVLPRVGRRGSHEEPHRTRRLVRHALPRAHILSLDDVPRPLERHVPA